MSEGAALVASEAATKVPTRIADVETMRIHDLDMAAYLLHQGFEAEYIWDAGIERMFCVFQGGEALASAVSAFMVSEAKALLEERRGLQRMLHTIEARHGVSGRRLRKGNQPPPEEAACG